MAPPSESKKIGNMKPIFNLDWSQDDCTVSLVITVKADDDVVEKEGVSVDVEENKLRIKLKVGAYIYIVRKELSHQVYLDCNVAINPKLKTVNVRLIKSVSGNSWESLGQSLEEDGDVFEAKDYMKRRFFREVTLSNKEQVTHDAYMFTFTPPKGTLMYVPVGQHVSLRATIKDTLVTRSYTPVIPSMEAAGNTALDGKHIYLMIKIYPTGQMTQKLHGMQIGDQILMADSVGTFVVHRHSDLESLVLLGAGTGFTPMVRMVHWALFQSKKIKHVKLMSFHKTRKDILWHDELEYLQQTDKRFVHEIILSEPDDTWTGRTGRVRSELLRDSVPSEQDTKLLVGICGPPPFTSAAAKLLEEAGYSSSTVHRFES